MATPKPVTELASLTHCPIAGRITEDRIKTLLGEVGDVWPASVKVEFIKDGASRMAR